MKPVWWLEEEAFAGEEHLDESYVAGYDAKSQVDPSEDIEKLVSLGLGESSVLVDLGAGTGVFSLAAAETGAAVVAVDVSPAMVDSIRERAEQSELDNITVVRAGFLSYDHALPPADFVYTRNALHQLPDFWKVIALNRIAALIRTGGHLLIRDLVFDLEPDDVEEGIEDWMSGAVDDPARGFTAEELAEHVRKEFSTFTWIFEPMLQRCGFDILEQSSRRSAYGTYLCKKGS
ncbi:MAG: class I SAM-dependent methyltransferase [Acidimicrobiia bacterium]